MDEAAATLFSHPWQSPLPEPSDGGAPLAWTPDIDDMLLLISRQHAFDFPVVATHVQRYIRNVHAAGGMLPKRVRRTPSRARPRPAAPSRAVSHLCALLPGDERRARLRRECLPAALGAA